MRRILFDPSALMDAEKSWFDAWSVRAETARVAAIAAVADAKDVSWDPAIWSDFKSWILQHVFHGKCGYCEWKIGRSFGAADHYRPKGGVTVADGTGRRGKVKNSSGASHEGYYWLAYTWWNLLPICDRCNSGTGKGTQFPIAGLRVFQATDLVDNQSRIEIDELELPLLLNPYFDDPDGHLVFGVEGVVVAAQPSIRGQETIEVMKLDDAILRDERKKVQEQARMALARAINLATEDMSRMHELLKGVFDRYCGVEAEFSASVRAHLEVFMQSISSYST